MEDKSLTSKGAKPDDDNGKKNPDSNKKTNPSMGSSEDHFISAAFVQLRGLPPDCRKVDVMNFFAAQDNGAPVSVYCEREGVLILRKRNDDCIGIGFAMFKNYEDEQKALMKNGKQLGTEKIEILPSSFEEIHKAYGQYLMTFAILNKMADNVAKDYLHLKGMPEDSTLVTVIIFFKELGCGVHAFGPHYIGVNGMMPKDEALIRMWNFELADEVQKTKNSEFMTSITSGSHVEITLCWIKPAQDIFGKVRNFPRSEVFAHQRICPAAGNKCPHHPHGMMPFMPPRLQSQIPMCSMGPIHRGPIHPGPIHRGPIHPGPIHRGPIHRGPINPGPIHRGPIHRGPIHPGPIHPPNPFLSPEIAGFTSIRDPVSYLNGFPLMTSGQFPDQPIWRILPAHQLPLHMMQLYNPPLHQVPYGQILAQPAMQVALETRISTSPPKPMPISDESRDWVIPVRHLPGFRSVSCPTLMQMNGFSKDVTKEEIMMLFSPIPAVMPANIFVQENTDDVQVYVLFPNLLKAVEVSKALGRSSLSAPETPISVGFFRVLFLPAVASCSEEESSI